MKKILTVEDFKNHEIQYGVTVNGRKYPYYVQMDDETYNTLIELMTTKPNLDKVKYEIRQLHNGNNKTSLVEKYFFLDLMYKVETKVSKKSIEKTLQNKDLMSYMVAKILVKRKLFYDRLMINNFLKCFSMSTFEFGGKPPNYPIKSVKEVLIKYNINDNYYDYSCGWGNRLLGSLVEKVNYHGTDPNYLLTERLKELADTYEEVNTLKSSVDIRTQGSEIFIPEWENKMGMAFSSPPYYDVEDYKIGDQSVKANTSYDEWLNTYWSGTVKNIKKYLVENGFFLLNMKNMKKYNLLDDMSEIILNNGFNLFGKELLVNITRKVDEDNNEDIVVFIDEHSDNPQTNNSSLESFFD